MGFYRKDMDLSNVAVANQDEKVCINTSEGVEKPPEDARLANFTKTSTPSRQPVVLLWH